MRHLNLGSYIECLKREGELHVIDEAVDPRLELAEIQRRVVGRQGPALLFRRVLGTKFPVVSNLFGTRRRIDLAFGEEPSRFIARVTEAAERLMAPSLSRLWEFRDLAKQLVRLGTRIRRSGPVLQCAMHPVRLKSLPQIQSWPGDGGAFLTLPLVYTEHPVTGNSNIGMYRVQIYEDSVAGMHFQIQRGMGFHYHEAEKLGKPLAANVFLGGSPALILSAIAPLPENVPEVVLASLLQGKKLSLIKNGEISSLPVVSEAEFALVGHVPPHTRRNEGPFGDHYGYYSLAHPYPVFVTEKIFHRKDALFPATVVGRPRQEDHYICEYLQELFSPVYPLVMNGVRAVWAYDDAGVHPLAAAVVRERYPREAFAAALRILGEGQLSLTKFLMVTDTPVQLQDFRALMRHILERADFSTDLHVFSPVSQDTLDYTSGTVNEGSKAVLMGLGDRRFRLQENPVAELKNEAFRAQRVFMPGLLVVEGPKWRQNDDAAGQLLQEEAVRPFRIVVLVDNARDCTRDDASFLWTVFTRFEPAADIHAKDCRLERFHALLSAPVVIDCRFKPWYPPPVEPLPETVARVDERWPALFPGE
ncbi:MAG: UbiD family decarboxylase [Acidobacteria bacterium]|nr:UbiD family decarboxylase [Acidobacteriota bacterium]